MNEENVTPFITAEIKEATGSACRMLAIREHSKKQIHDKLLKKGFTIPTIEYTLVYLVDENWLCESRFCSSYIRSKSSKGQGLMKIEMELRQQNISLLIIRAALIEESINWQKICERTLLKKMTAFEPSENVPAEQKFNQRVKLEKFLSYRGFSSDEIKLAINRCFS